MVTARIKHMARLLYSVPTSTDEHAKIIMDAANMLMESCDVDDAPCQRCGGNGVEPPQPAGWARDLGLGTDDAGD